MQFVSDYDINRQRLSCIRNKRPPGRSHALPETQSRTYMNHADSMLRATDNSGLQLTKPPSAAMPYRFSFVRTVAS